MTQAAEARRGRLLSALGACAFGASLLVAGCSPSPQPSPTPKVLTSLPPGFSVRSSASPLVTPGVLQAAPAGRLDLSSLQRAPLPSDQIRSVTLAVVNQPVTTAVRPLLVTDTSLRPSSSLVVVAGRLPSDRPHDCEFILQGPGLRAERLVAVARGVAAARVTLPSHMTAGIWALAAEDVSQLRTGDHNEVAGTVVLDLGIFTVTS